MSFDAIAQRRQLDRHDCETVVKIFAESFPAAPLL
jgi:hypothetical protein